MSLTGRGNSSDWQAQKSRAATVFELFRASTPDRQATWSQPWAQLTEAELCGAAIYDAYGHCLLHEYKI